MIYQEILENQPSNTCINGSGIMHSLAPQDAKLRIAKLLQRRLELANTRANGQNAGIINGFATSVRAVGELGGILGRASKKNKTKITKDTISINISNLSNLTVLPTLSTTFGQEKSLFSPCAPEESSQAELKILRRNSSYNESYFEICLDTFHESNFTRVHLVFIVPAGSNPLVRQLGMRVETKDSSITLHAKNYAKTEINLFDFNARTTGSNLASEIPTSIAIASIPFEAKSSSVERELRFSMNLVIFQGTDQE